MAADFKAARIDAGDQDWSVWVVDNNNRLWQLASPAPDQPLMWINEPDAGAVDVGVDAHGNAWVVNPVGEIYVREASGSKPGKGKWVKRTPLGSKIKRIAAGTTNILALDDKKQIWRYGGATWQRDTLASNVKDIAVGSPDTLFCINEAGQYYKRSRGSKDWGSAMGPLNGFQTMAVGYDDTLTYLGPNGWVHDWRDGSFKPDSIAKGVDLGVRNREDIWLINEKGEIWRRTPTEVKNPLVQAAVPLKDGARQIAVWHLITPPQYLSAKVYWAQPGDTFDTISKAVGIDSGTLKARNAPLASASKLKGGEKVTLG